MTIPKTAKTLNEPLQFKLSRSDQYYELVINGEKDTIIGYLSAPKAGQVRK